MCLYKERLTRKDRVVRIKGTIGRESRWGQKGPLIPVASRHALSLAEARAGLTPTPWVRGNGTILGCDIFGLEDAWTRGSLSSSGEDLR